MGYIKQITIQGFKSYKDQTKIEPFSPKSNIVVGRNGAGKSNFFAAVRFVLGDECENFTREERHALLHEGSGSAVMSAYVEVIFDNSDSRFHNNGKPEFTLRRTIGAKKDEYSMDRKNATKREVFEMLEAAGLSRSNPFYIVPQGRVTAITNMKDEERLNMLKDISGSNVYEKRRADSLKLMADTQNRCERIDNLVNDISGRLQELEGEKKELEAWNKNDRERRALLFLMNSRREEALEEQIGKLEEFRHNGVDGVDDKERQFRRVEDEMSQIDKEIGEFRTELQMLEADRAQLDSDRNNAARQKAAIELEYSDLVDGQSAAQQSQRRRETTLKDLRQDISKREAALAALLPQYKVKFNEEESARSQLAEAEGHRKRLEDKQGRSATYTSKKQRDDALQRQVTKIDDELATRKSIQYQTRDDIEAAQKEIGKLEKGVSELSSSFANEDDDRIARANNIQQSRDAHDSIRDKQMELLRNQERLRIGLRKGEDEMHSSKQKFNFLLDHSTSRGLETLQRLRKHHDLSGIHGTIAELVDVPEFYKIPMEVAAGNSLFNVVCDNDATAAKAIELLNKERGGRLTFMALNRLKRRDINLPNTNDAMPLLPKLSYEPAYENAFRQVFGRVVVCPDLSICQSFARTHDVLALTPQGDRANKKGGYHGGYFDPSKWKLDAFRKVAAVREQVESQQAQSRDIQTELDLLQQKLTAAASAVRKAEYEQTRAENEYLPRRQQLRGLQKELDEKRRSLEALQRQAQLSATTLNELSSQQDDLRNEIASDFKKALSRDEEAQLQSLTSTVRDLNKQYAALSDERAELETHKTEIELALTQNLRPRLDELEAQQTGAGGGGSQSVQLKECERALKKVNKTIDGLDHDIRKVEVQRSNATTQLAQLEESKSERERTNRELARQIEKQQNRMEKGLRDAEHAKQELQAVQADIRELGTLPEDAYAKFTRMHNDRLVSELDKANKALKKYSHVNKKAFQQYEDFTRKREQLNQRRGELDSSRSHIETLIDVLDQRKDEAIHRTFRQVAKNFQDVFVQLVPAGKGRLIIQKRADRRGDADSDDDENPNARQNGSAGVESFTGVGIAVSFNSKHDEQQRIQQLSGGQKALCALALVFAIQQCDPAPFYLFDEIDANLDAQYRTAVAEMLRKLSGKGGAAGEGGGQFICTTFRPEMVLVADKCYAVSYKNSNSRIDVFDREGALAFVETSQKTA